MSRGNPTKPPSMVYIFTGVVNDVVAWEMVRGLNAWTTKGCTLFLVFRLVTEGECSGIRRVYRRVCSVMVE